MPSTFKKEQITQGFQRAANDTKILEFADQGLEDYSCQLDSPQILAETHL